MTSGLGEWPPETMSVAEKLADLSPDERRKIELSLSQDQKDALEWDWDFWGRPDQKPPDRFTVWTYISGRAAGKTRAITEWMRKKGPNHREGLIIGANPRDVRDVLLEGKSGILNISPPWERPIYEPTKLRLQWPNGAVAHIRSAEDPHSIRGLSVEWAACDELVKWRFLQETWDQSRLALREGANVQTVVATTPMPLPLIKKLVEGKGPGYVVAPRVSTYRNLANLSPDYIQELLDTYEGTRLGLQELHAEILDDVKGALWTHEMIEGARWKGDTDAIEWTRTPSGLVPSLPQIRHKVVGVDPSGSTTGDEWGIVVVGSDRSRRPVGYVLDDRSQRGSPEDCARAAVRAYYDHGCDEMVGETNFGAEMVGRMIAAVPAEGTYPAGDSVRFKAVRAGRGMSKYQRAVPVVGFYEQNLRGFQRIYHLGVFKDLEQQQVTWVPPEQADGIEIFASKWSPDRVDACLVAGTLVETDHGAVPIERVTCDHSVWTRNGWRPVIWAGQTQSQAEVLQLRTTGGSLTGTPNHLIATPDRGFVRLDALVCGDRVWTCETPWFSRTWSTFVGRWLRRDPLGSTTPPTPTTEESPVLLSSTLPSGSAATDPSRPGTTSTTSTSTRSTTSRTTSLLSPPKSTPRPMKARSTTTRRNGRRILRPSDLSPPSGTRLPRGWSGTASTARPHGSTGRPSMWSASTAERPISRRSLSALISVLSRVAKRRGTPSAAIRSKSPVRNAEHPSGGASTGRSRRLVPSVVVGLSAAGRADVFDLTVEETHEFVANGVVVHNCVWGAMELLVINTRRGGRAETDVLTSGRVG